VRVCCLLEKVLCFDFFSFFRFVEISDIQEAGFGSGLTKEFLTNVIQQSFTPGYGYVL
jgi:hypothetical protein